MTPKEFTKAVQPQVIANKNFNKVFCIGYNKTGTTTLETVLRLYGYIMPNQQQQEIRLSKSTFRTDYSELAQFCNNYDAFQDMPFSQDLTYVAADAIFPNSKFILTERPAESWYNSLYEFHKKRLNVSNLSEVTEKDIIDKLTYLYPGYAHSNTERMLSSFKDDSRTVRWDKLYDFDWYTDMYQRRNEEIKRYFMQAPNKLLVIDITKEETTKRICEFLNIPTEFAIDMPHSNKT